MVAPSNHANFGKLVSHTYTIGVYDPLAPYQLRPFRAQKSEPLVPILLLVPKSLLHCIPITATAHDHHAKYLQPHNSPHGPNDSTLHYLAILVPHNKLVMKSYIHQHTVGNC
jgi:hypothetical protein